MLKTPVLVAFRQASYGRNMLFKKPFRPQDDQPKAIQAGNLLPVVSGGVGGLNVIARLKISAFAYLLFAYLLFAVSSQQCSARFVLAYGGREHGNALPQP